MTCRPLPYTENNHIRKIQKISAYFFEITTNQKIYILWTILWCINPEVIYRSQSNKLISLMLQVADQS